MRRHRSPGDISRARTIGLIVVLLMALAATALLAPPAHAQAQTTVLSCAADWGASASCGGCSDLRWSLSSTDPKVYSPDATYWTRFSALPSTARVATSTNPAGAATCSTGNLVTKAALLGSPPSPPPPPVTPPTSGTGTAVLSWTLPTTNVDGSPLTNLAATEVFSGLSPTSLAFVTSVPAPGTTYTVSGLVNGTWYFTVRAVKATGEVSGMSATVSLVVNVPNPTPSCGAAPANETRTVQCPAPQVGSWSQMRTYVSAAYPTCWLPSDWLPATTPAGACTTPPPPPPPAPTWKVAPNGTSATRPAYELILNAAGTANVRGYQLGTVPVSKPCSDAREISGTTEYHRVAEADVTLQSPTYRGRALVAVCSRQ